MSRALQLSVLLVGFCQIHRGLSAEDAGSTSRESGEVPVSQLRMLSLGLAHLLHGVERNGEQLEQQGAQVAAEMDGVTRSLESLHKKSLQAGRTNRQVRETERTCTFHNERKENKSKRFVLDVCKPPERMPGDIL